jgi:hypothetical protein
VRKSLQQILAEYGPVAVVVYFALFFLVLIGTWVGIHLGWQPGSAAGNVGVFTGAYLFTKVTQPFRIAATLGMTPFAAKAYARFGPKRRPIADSLDQSPIASPDDTRSPRLRG